MTETLLLLAIASLIIGGLAGATIGALYGYRKVVDLADFYHPDYRRIFRGALIGMIFGAFIMPKICVVGYVLFLVFIK